MRQDRTEWAISRLRRMPEPLFYRSIILLGAGYHSVSAIARMLLREPDRGALQAATFHTLRTYLTPVHRILHQWRASGFASGSTPAIYQETQNWLQQQANPSDA